MHIETFLTQYMSRPIHGTLNWINSHAFGFLVLRIEYISVPWLILLQFSGSYDLSWDTVSTKPFLSIQSRHGVSLPTFFCWECQLEPDLLTYWILYERQFADSNFECILLHLLCGGVGGGWVGGGWGWVGGGGGGVWGGGGGGGGLGPSSCELPRASNNFGNTLEIPWQI